jgi:hypothetical protein
MAALYLTGWGAHFNYSGCRRCIRVRPGSKNPAEEGEYVNITAPGNGSAKPWTGF